jgi:hypothetical protein
MFRIMAQAWKSHYQLGKSVALQRGYLQIC